MKLINKSLLYLTFISILCSICGYKISVSCCVAFNRTYLTTSSCYTICYRDPLYSGQCNPTCNDYWEGSTNVWAAQVFLVDTEVQYYDTYNGTSASGTRHSFSKVTPPIGPPSCTYQSSGSYGWEINGTLSGSSTCQ